MYDELVKRLRNRRICIQQLGTLNDYPLLGEAADAIEALSKLALDEHNRTAVAAWERRWIPVSESLPEMRTWEDNGLRCSSSVLFRTDRTIHIGYVIEDSYNDEYAGEVKLHRWYMQGGYRIENVTHWMPLPQGPEEE